MAKKEDIQKNLRKYMDKIEAAENYRDRGYRDKWTRFYKRWRNFVDELKGDDGKPLKGRSNISIPYSFTMVETILPRLVETLFAARPYISVKSRRREYISNGEKMETLLDYQTNECFDIQDKFHSGLKTMVIYGTTVGYVGWKYKEKSIIRKESTPIMMEDDNGPMLDEMGQPQPMIDQMTGQPMTELKPFKSTETAYDDPELDFLDLGLFYVDPNATDIDDARFCGHVCFENKAFIQEMHDQGIWQVDFKKVPKSSNRNQARNYRMSSIGLPTTDDANLIKEETELYEIHYYWEDDKSVVIINRGYIAADGDNPYWHQKKPYVKDVYTKVPGEFYGIGIMEVNEDLQDELNTERNQRIDYRSMSLRRMFSVRRGAKITPEGWQFKNHGKIEVDNHDDLKEIEVKPLNNDSFTQENIIKQDMQDATGAQDVVIGASATGETATTTMSKDNNASMRFKIVISSIEKRLLVGVARFMIQLNQQFIDKARILDITGDQGDDYPEITPEEIQGDFRLVAAGSSVEPMANKEAFKQRMVELYSLASKDPFYQQFPVKRRNLLKKVFEAFDMKNTDDVLPSEEEMMESAAQQAKAAMQEQEQAAMQQQQSQAMTSQQAEQSAGLKQQDLELKRQGLGIKAMQAERSMAR